MTNQVTPEVAASELDRIIEAFDLDLDESDMDAEDKIDYQKLRKTAVRAIMRGTLVVSEKGDATVKAKLTKDDTIDIVFSPDNMTGAVFMAMDNKGKNADVRKMYAAMAEATGVPAATFSRMLAGSLKVCQALFTLFLS